MTLTRSKPRATDQEVTLILPRLHAAQQEIKRGAARFNVLNCGRRFGKDILLIDVAVQTLLAGYPVGWFNPSYKMLTEVWRTLKNLLQPITTRLDSQEHRIEIVTGGVLDMWSLDAYDSARGRKYKRVIINEAAMSPHLRDAWENVIRPMLTDYQGDAYFGSTPKGRNYFATLLQRGYDPAQPEWRAFHYPTSANPYLDKREIEAARNDLPSDVYEQEYEARILENQGSVFRNIAANLTAPHNSPPDDHKDHTIVTGIDWAQKQDYTVISVGCVDCKRELVLDRFNKIGWGIQRDRLTAIWDAWGVQWGYAEANSIGGPNIEALNDAGYDVVGFDTTSTSKGPLIKSLALSLERVEVAFLDDAVGKAELEAYEVSVSAQTGHASYSAPDGMHDDTVIARALMRKAILEGNHTGVY